jgi:PAS domain S-box-containing protein
MAANALEPTQQQPFFLDRELISAALRAGQIGIWSWDMATNRAEWSSNIEDICGISREPLGAAMAALESRIHPEDRDGVVAALQEALLTRSPRRVQYRLSPKHGGDERWVETVAAVAVESGRPIKLFGTFREVTARMRVHRELRMRASQQEAIARLGARALMERDLQRFLDEAVQAIARTLGVEMVKILELVPGDAELLLRAGIGWKPGLVGTALVSTSRDSQAGFTLAAGGPVIVEDLASETRFCGQPLLHQHGVQSGLTVPIAGRDGRAYGVLGAHTASRRRFSGHETSFVAAIADMVAAAIQRRQSEYRQELMIRELRHRSGNLFAQLLALFSQTARTSRTFAELVPKFEARVLALANAHRLITEGGWKSAPVAQILNPLLAPFIERISLSGPDVFLEPDPAFGLSTAVHELATNASKYGSLSLRPGRVEVSWTVERSKQGLLLRLDWKERNGPPPKRRRRRGFGAKLIRTVIERSLGGRVRQSFGPKGLETRLTFPLAHERWPNAPASTGAAPPPGSNAA